MDPKDFDDILKQKLKGFESSSNATPDWDRMERDLDSQKDQVFDEQVKRKLSQLSVNSFSSSNWSKLYDLISTKLLRKRTVLLSKSLEIATLLILIFSLGQLGWLNEFKKDVHYADSFAESIKKVIEPGLDVKVIKELEGLNTDSNNLLNKSLTLQIPTQNNSTNLIASVKEVSNSNITNNYEKELINQENSNITLNSGGIFDFTELDRNTILNVSSSKEIFAEVDQNRLHGLVDDKVLEVQNMNLLAIHNVVPEKELKIQGVVEETNFSKHRFFIDFETNLAIANIESALRNLPSRNKNADISTNKLYPVISSKIGMRHKNGTVSTGVEYQSISYNPAVSHVSGELSSILTETQIESVNYNIVSIPLTFSWNILGGKKWDLRLNTGLVTNLITNVDLIANQTLTSGGGTRITKIDNENVDYSAFPLAINNGIFDDNFNQKIETPSPYFFQTRTGLQIERNVSRNTSIISNFNFNYQLPILDLGVQDNINSYSIGIAVRKYFG